MGCVLQIVVHEGAVLGLVCADVCAMRSHHNNGLPRGAWMPQANITGNLSNVGRAAGISGWSERGVLMAMEFA